MAEIALCPHRNEWVDKGQMLKVLVTEEGDYGELCDDCVYDLLSHLIAKLPHGRLKIVLHKALREATAAGG